MLRVWSTASDGTSLAPGDEFSGSFEYIPNAVWPGDDSFSYRATDGIVESEVAFVSIHTRDLVEWDIKWWEIDGVRHDLEERTITTYHQKINCVAPATTPMQDVFDAASDAGISGDKISASNATITSTPVDVYELEEDMEEEFVFHGPAIINLPQFMITAEYIDVGGPIVATQEAWEDTFRVYQDGIQTTGTLSTASQAIDQVSNQVRDQLESLINQYSDGTGYFVFQ